MRKQIIPQSQQPSSAIADETWLDLQRLADVEITSEDSDHPIESALTAEGDTGWLASQAGKQTIRLIFSSPQRIRRVRLEFIEPHAERTQEFSLHWSSGDDESLQQLVRQQWNFSPAGATHEVEDYRVDLADVAMIELTITPDTSGGDARASLARLLLA